MVSMGRISRKPSAAGMNAQRTSKKSFSPGAKGIRLSCASQGKEEIRRREIVKVKGRKWIMKSIYHENTKKIYLSQSHRETQRKIRMAVLSLERFLIAPLKVFTLRSRSVFSFSSRLANRLGAAARVQSSILLGISGRA
jgi:hypothetical protein